MLELVIQCACLCGFIYEVASFLPPPIELVWSIKNSELYNLASVLSVGLFFCSKVDLGCVWFLEVIGGPAAAAVCLELAHRKFWFWLDLFGRNSMFYMSWIFLSEWGIN